MLPEIVTEKDAETYQKAMNSPQGVYFVTTNNEEKALAEQQARFKEMNEKLGAIENGGSSGISGPEQTVGDVVEPHRDATP